MNVLLNGRRRDARRGFTAVEVSMVATIIAILVLIATPMFRTRIEQGRITAAKAEMDRMITFIQLAKGEAGIHPRLQDLDNTDVYNSANPNAFVLAGSHEELPIAKWNAALTREERGALSKNWGGPYLAFKNFIYIDELMAEYPFLIRDHGQIAGPILVVATGPHMNDQMSLALDKYPLDPWGNPYIFFGEGTLNPDGTGSFPENYDFQKCAIISMGSNGLPGDGPSVGTLDYRRWPVGQIPANMAALGTGDDILFEF